MGATTLIDRRPKLSLPIQQDRSELIDGAGRTIDYLRLSVTDRCDLRCTYCMPKKMQFSPKSEVLTYQELHQLAQHFIARGVRKIRLTGGEPLVRKDVVFLIEALGQYLTTGELQELVLTTNGTQLAKYAARLAQAGVRRINVSLDHIDPLKYKMITRGGNLSKVLLGLEAAKTAGLKIKINMVVIKGVNSDHVTSMMRWAHEEGYDLTLIEAMPLGDSGTDRKAEFEDLRTVKSKLDLTYTLTPSTYNTAGPSRYYHVAETGGKIGFISPLSNHFCESCNRVRLTCTGQLYSCLGHEGVTDLRKILRAGGDLDVAINDALSRKPVRHDFSAEHPEHLATLRHMSVTGG